MLIGTNLRALNQPIACQQLTQRPQMLLVVHLQLQHLNLIRK